jgi:hypothetical protein
LLIGVRVLGVWGCWFEWIRDAEEDVIASGGAVVVEHTEAMGFEVVEEFATAGLSEEGCDEGGGDEHSSAACVFFGGAD